MLPAALDSYSLATVPASLVATSTRPDVGIVEGCQNQITATSQSPVCLNFSVPGSAITITGIT